MLCASCHTLNPEGHRFCESCGGALAWRCGSCGFDCGAQARFCGGCGKPRGQPAAANTLPAVAQRSALTPAPTGWAELKQATVLFADIVASTEQIAHLDPEEAMARLKPAVQAMCEAVERYGGTIMRTLGDGVMALFGVPKALEGHARLACEAALHMQAAFHRQPRGLTIRVGLHSGLIAIGPAALDGGRGGDAHGMTIHIASRVVGEAPAGGIVVTSACCALVRSAVVASSRGLRQLKGVPHEVEIFELAALRADSPMLQFHHGALTSFRGRQHEMALLVDAARTAASGDARVVGIAGAPGTGKSRLCFEFARACRERHVRVVEVRSRLYGHATPLQLALELVRRFLLRVNEADDPLIVRRAIRDCLSVVDDAVPGDSEVLADFLGVADPALRDTAVSPAMRKARLHGLLRRLVQAEGREHAVLCIEDLHWIDEASEGFVSTLVQALVGTRLLVVLNYRTSYIAPWLQLPHYRQIELGLLSPGDTDAMVRELVTTRRGLNDLYQLITERSGGNPFFAEELVRSLTESGVLGTEEGSPVLWEEVGRALPSTVQAVIGERIDRLEETEKTLLQMCAIIGKEVPLAVLLQVARMPKEAVQRLLERLCRLELVQPEPAEGERRFVFTHPLIQEVAYSAQMRMRRASIHASVAEAMQSYYSDRLDEYAALVAYHYESSGAQSKAAIFEGRAAQWVGATDSARAIKHWNKVRKLLQGAPNADDRDRLRAMACSKIVLLGWREGMTLEEVNECLREGMELAQQSDTRLTQLLLFLDGRLQHANGGSADGYMERVSRALRLTGPDDVGRRATLNAALSQAYAWAGFLAQGLAANDQALQGIAAIDAFDREFIGFSIEGWLLGIRARLLTRMGRGDEARAVLDRMTDNELQGADPVLRQIVHYAYVDLGAWHDEPGLAARHAAHATEIADTARSPYLRMVAEYCCGTASLSAGQPQPALAAFSKALAVVRESNVAMEFETEILGSVAECQRQQGELAAAEATAREAISIARRRGHRLVECRALITLGSALGAEGERATEAGQCFEQAEELVATTGAVVCGRLLAQARGAGSPQAARQASSVNSPSP